MQGGIYNCHVLCHSVNAVLAQHKALKFLNVGIVNIRANHGIQACFLCLVFGHGLYGGIIGNLLYLIHNPFVMGRGNLGAISRRQIGRGISDAGESAR
jgi:hypothetical protein